MSIPRHVVQVVSATTGVLIVTVCTFWFFENRHITGTGWLLLLSCTLNAILVDRILTYYFLVNFWKSWPVTYTVCDTLCLQAECKCRAFFIRRCIFGSRFLGTITLALGPDVTLLQDSSRRFFFPSLIFYLDMTFTETTQGGVKRCFSRFRYRKRDRHIMLLYCVDIMLLLLAYLKIMMSWEIKIAYNHPAVFYVQNTVLMSVHQNILLSWYSVLTYSVVYCARQ